MPIDDLDLEYHGTLREELDIKLLLLFILRRLPGAVKGELLAELALTYARVGYFEYASCLGELIDAGHVQQSFDGFRITEKGDRNCSIVESSLPYSIRSALEKKLKPMAEDMRRLAMIGAAHTVGDDGCQVELKLSDGVSSILELRILCGGEAQALKIEELFRRRAENTYQNIMKILTEE
ncbi:MAG: DUF4364 family protein [Oscillospiraceae bacterium]|nr:DUF4364 family protein [Oscillospiraceae bacterium]